MMDLANTIHTQRQREQVALRRWVLWGCLGSTSLHLWLMLIQLPPTAKPEQTDLETTTEVLIVESPVEPVEAPISQAEPLDSQIETTVDLELAPLPEVATASSALSLATPVEVATSEPLAPPRESETPAPEPLAQIAETPDAQQPAPAAPELKTPADPEPKAQPILAAAQPQTSPKPLPKLDFSPLASAFRGLSTQPSPQPGQMTGLTRPSRFSTQGGQAGARSTAASLGTLFQPITQPEGSGGPATGSDRKPTPPSQPRRPACLSCPAPEFQGAEGVTEFTYDIRPDGTVTNVRLVRSSGDSATDRAALESIRNRRYQPSETGVQGRQQRINFAEEGSAFHRELQERQRRAAERRAAERRAAEQQRRQAERSAQGQTSGQPTSPDSAQPDQPDPATAGADRPNSDADPNSTASQESPPATVSPEPAASGGTAPAPAETVPEPPAKPPAPAESPAAAPPVPAGTPSEIPSAEAAPAETAPSEPPAN